MAKDNPEDQTAPIYNPDGTIAGYTTPEKAAELEAAFAPAPEVDLGGWDNFDYSALDQAGQDQFDAALATNPEFIASLEAQETSPYSNPLQTTGTWDDGTKVTMFDPLTGEYITKDVDPNNPMEFNPGGDQTMWGNANGEHQLIYTGGDGWQDTGASVMDSTGDGTMWTWGAETQPIEQYEGPFSLGGPPTTTQPPVQPPVQPPIETPIPVDPPPPDVNPPVQPPTTVQPPPEPPDNTDPIDTDPDPYIPIDWDLLDPGAPDVPNSSTDLPTPGGGPTEDWTGEGAQADMSWNWDAFAPKDVGDGAWGGYDADYGVFERYQPGMESPWGMPDTLGGNKAFYQQQFNNQLRDEQGYQNRERAAQMRRQEAAANPEANIDYEDMWDSMGFEKSLASEGNPNTILNPDGSVAGIAAGYNPQYDLGAGNTNREIIAGLGNIWTDSEKGLWDEWGREQEAAGPGPAGNLWGDSQFIGSFGNADDFMTAFNANQGPDGTASQWQALHQKLANNLWTPAISGAQAGINNVNQSGTPVGYANVI